MKDLWYSQIGFLACSVHLDDLRISERLSIGCITSLFFNHRIWLKIMVTVFHFLFSSYVILLVWWNAVNCYSHVWICCKFLVACKFADFCVNCFIHLNWLLVNLLISVYMRSIFHIQCLVKHVLWQGPCVLLRFKKKIVQFFIVNRKHFNH